MRIALALALACLAAPAAAQPEACNPDPLDCDLDVAIVAALDHLRRAEGGDGRFGGDRVAAALAGYALLRRPHGPGAFGRALGYTHQSPADQALLDRIARALIEGDPALTDPDAAADPVATGLALRTLAVLLLGGGPEAVGAPVTVVDAIDSGVRALHAARHPPPVPGWGADGVVDMRATYAATLGLAAAGGISAGADEPLAALPAALMALADPDGGVAPRVGAPADVASTGAALHAWRLAQVPASDPRVQALLGWLLERPGGVVDAVGAPGWGLFGAVAGLRVSEDDGLGGATYADAFGVRLPIDRGHLVAPSAGYDAKILLLDAQDPETGAFAASLEDHLWPLPVLYFGRWAHCLDDDEDGLCNQDDNCPDVANPDQADEDFDGVGDLCEAMPDAGVEPDADAPDADAPDAALDAAPVDEGAEPDAAVDSAVEPDAAMPDAARAPDVPRPDPDAAPADAALDAAALDAADVGERPADGASGGCAAAPGPAPAAPLFALMAWLIARRRQKRA